MDQVADIEQLIDIEAIKKLPVSTRRQLIDAIEETIEKYDEEDEENYAYETDEELQILEDRLQEYVANPQNVTSLEDLKKEFLTDGRG